MWDNPSEETDTDILGRDNLLVSNAANLPDLVTLLPSIELVGKY